MRLALNFQTPAIEQALWRHAPGLELVRLSATGAPVGDVDALLTPLVDTQPLAELLPTCHGLKWVHIFSTGVDTFPFDLAGGRQVSCSRGASAVGIAEWVLAIARRALAFDMRIIAKVRRHRLSPMAGVELAASLDQVLYEADHLVLALPATAESRGLLDAERLALTKPGAHLVNVARSGLIDQHVRLSPHISWSAPGMVERMPGVFLRNLEAFVHGRPLEGVADVAAGY